MFRHVRNVTNTYALKTSDLTTEWRWPPTVVTRYSGTALGFHFLSVSPSIYCWVQSVQQQNWQNIRRRRSADVKCRGKLRCLFAKWRTIGVAGPREGDAERCRCARLVPWFSPVGRRRVAGRLRWLGLGRRRRCRSNAEFHAALARRSTGVER